MNRSMLVRKVTSEVHRLSLAMVNVYLIQQARGWVLVDAGLVGTAGRIARAAEELFGNQPPRAIVLTHGHFDHVGALQALLERWEVPVYAHPLELPYLSGQSAYPPPDPSVGGGLLSELSWLFPRQPINLAEHLQALDTSGEVPGLPDYRWIHTPGHSPGHISLYDPHDRTLIVGDAFVTIQQESVYAALTKPASIQGPPAYFTCDWKEARASVQTLEQLEVEVVATGHGRPMGGNIMREQLTNLAERFDQLALPKQGRYVEQPAITDETGVVWLPPINEGAGISNGLKDLARRTLGMVRRISEPKGWGQG